MVKTNAHQGEGQPPKVDEAEAVGDVLTVRGKLALLGWPSVDAWARAHGYERMMAGYCVRIWGNRTDRRPHGGIARALMRDLRETLRTGKRPDVEAEQPTSASACEPRNSHVGARGSDLAGRLAEVIGSEHQVAFAKRCGFGESTLRSYLRGSDPSTTRLVAMAQAGNVSVDWLATGRGRKVPQ